MQNSELTFGDYIKTIRQSKGLTLSEVSNMMDNEQYVSNSYLSKLESNVRANPTIVFHTLNLHQKIIKNSAINIW